MVVAGFRLNQTYTCEIDPVLIGFNLFHQLFCAISTHIDVIYKVQFFAVFEEIRYATI